jgi:hypothetical protein
MFTYNAYAHPQFDRDGELLISYNTNGDFWSIFNDVEIYRPRFIRVPYMNLDYAFWPNSFPEFERHTSFSMKIYPNPFISRATLSIDLKASGSGQLEILDMKGRLLYCETDIPMKQGENRLSVNLTENPAGIYLCRFIFRGNVYTTRIVKSSTQIQ